MPRKKESPSRSVRITLLRSPIGYSRDQKATLRALGLRRLHQTVEHKDTPALRGMLDKITHLIRIEE